MNYKDQFKTVPSTFMVLDSLSEAEKIMCDYGLLLDVLHIVEYEMVATDVVADFLERV